MGNGAEMTENGRKKGGNGRVVLWVSLLVAVALSTVFFTVGRGYLAKLRERRRIAALPVVVTNRMADARYLADLLENRRGQGKIAAARAPVVEAMNRKVEAARAKFPEEAGAVALATNEAERAALQGKLDDKIRAELEKDPEWKNLQSENQKHLDALEGQLEKARETVRNRLARERADAEAVRRGRARVAD